jgi:hypothetical protein
MARVDTRRELHRQLWASSSNLSAIPAEFDPDKIYRIKVTKAVTAPDHSFPFRPDQDVQVSGKIAEEIREFISGAVVVG